MSKKSRYRAAVSGRTIRRSRSIARFSARPDEPRSGRPIRKRCRRTPSVPTAASCSLLMTTICAASLVTMLRESYRIIEAEDGISALEKAMRAIPDLILLDVMLPGVSGLEVCRSLKEKAETRAIKIIVLTARADEEAKIIALKHGADDFLIKPFSWIGGSLAHNQPHSGSSTRARSAANQFRIEAEPAAAPRDGSSSGTKRKAKRLGQRWPPDCCTKSAIR